MSRRVGVVMLARDQAAYVEATLASLMSESGCELDVVLVDNGSGPEVAAAFDAFEESARAAGHGVRRLRFETNVGAVRGRNEALALVDPVACPYVAWLDSDVLAPACAASVAADRRTGGWLAKLAAYLDSHADVGIVAPKLVYPWPPHDIQCAGCDATRSGRIVFRGRGEPRDDARFNTERDCPSLISACWLMRTRLFAELGPLDERFSPVQFEDPDYCYRAREAGLRCVYLPAVEMYHFEGTTSGNLESHPHDLVLARNAVKFKRKWREVIEREGGIDDADVPPWKKAVGWRAIGEVEL